MSRISARDGHIKILDGNSASKNISGRANAYTLSFTSEEVDVTCFGDLYRSRVADGLRDWTIEFGGFWDGAACQIDDILFSVLAACTSVCLYPGGSAATTYWSGCAIMQDYTVEGAVEGGVSYSATFMAASTLNRTGPAGI
jgi:hypothetical protein